MSKNSDSLPAGAPHEQAQSRMLRVGKNIAYGLIATLFFFGVLEVSARLIGFEFQRARFRFVAAGKVLQARYLNTAELWWEPDPRSPQFNEDGFVGPRIAKQRTPGVLRVAVLGDSCTELGDPPYSAHLQTMLAQSRDGKVEVLNAGVAGYTTYQGLLRLQKSVLLYRPDVVSLYFGWNDHFMVQKLSDKEVMSRKTASWPMQILDTFSGSRVVQIGFFVEDLVRKPPAEPDVASVFRVDLEMYRKNLVEMVKLIRETEALPILVTGPTDMTQETPIAHFHLLKDLPKTKYATPKELHDDYMQTLRRAARETDAVLLDAQVAFEAQAHRYLQEDHVHLTEAGRQRMAQLLAGAILERFPE